MFKKIVLIVSAVFSGANLGAISCACPIYLAVYAFITDGTNDLNFFAATALITALISGISIYVYSYRRKREHEESSVFIKTFAWSFTLGALVCAIVMFILAGDAAYDIGQRLV